MSPSLRAIVDWLNEILVTVHLGQYGRLEGYTPKYKLEPPQAKTTHHARLPLLMTLHISGSTVRPQLRSLLQRVAESPHAA